MTWTPTTVEVLDYHQNYAPLHRQKLHRKIISKFVENKTTGSSFIVLVGVPGSGKTFTARRLTNHVLLDVDEILLELPEYNGGTGENQRLEALYILNRIFYECCKKSLNIVYTTTLASNSGMQILFKYLAICYGLSYNIGLCYKMSPKIETILLRIKCRSGRTVDENYLNRCILSTPLNFQQLLRSEIWLTIKRSI